MMTKNERLESDIDWLQGIMSCQNCPMSKVRDDSEKYDEIFNPCDFEECAVDKFKDYLMELRDLRDETEEQKEIIHELLEEVE